MSKNAKLIYTVEGLRAMELDGSYALGSDLDLGGADWMPLGTEEAAFSGVLDGCGHTISNFRITGTGDVGFFGVLEGQVWSLNFENVTLETRAEDKSRVGLLAGASYGEFGGVKISGGVMKVTAQDDAVLYCGTFVGENYGLVRNVTSTMDVFVDAGKAEAWVGGFFGICGAGLIERVEPLGELILTGENVKAATYAAKIWNTELIANRFSCEMNTLNGRLVNNYAVEEAEDVVWDACVWRDNSNHDRFLPAENYAIRKDCADYMNQMATWVWTPDRDMEYVSSAFAKVHHQVFPAGKPRVGMCYTHLSNSYAKLRSCFRGDGSVQPWICSEGYNGMDLYFGNDCSSAVGWALSRAVNNFSWRWTWDMLPIHGLGAIPCGEYDALCGETTDVIVSTNGWDVMAEAFAKLNIGDSMVNFRKGSGHARLVTRNSVVYRKRDGAIDIHESYATTTEQGNGLLPENARFNSSCMPNYRYHFLELLRQDYIPLTYQILQDGVRPQRVVTLKDRGEGREGVNSGIVEANFRIDTVTAEILDENGSRVWQRVHFPSHRAFREEDGSGNARIMAKEFDLRALRPYFNGRGMKSGKTYTYRVEVRLITDETFRMEDLTFVW